MAQVWPLSWKQRVRGVLPPLGVAAGLVALLVVFGGRTEPWRVAVVAVIAVLLLGRAAWDLRRRHWELVVDAAGVSLADRSIRFDGAALELKMGSAPDTLKIREALLWGPEDAGALSRPHIRVEPSLNGFEEALRAIVVHLPEANVTLTAPGEPVLADERRTQVLGRLRERM